MNCRYKFIANFVYLNVRYGRSFSQELALLSAGECFKRKQPQHVFLSCSLLHPIILIKRQHAEKHDTSSSHSFLVGLTFPTVIFKPLRMATINHEKSKQHGYEPRAFSYHLYTYKNVALFAFHDRALKLTISLFNDLQIRVKTALNCQKLVVSVRNVV